MHWYGNWECPSKPAPKQGTIQRREKNLRQVVITAWRERCSKDKRSIIRIWFLEITECLQSKRGNLYYPLLLQLHTGVWCLDRGIDLSLRQLPFFLGEKQWLLYSTILIFCLWKDKVYWWRKHSVGIYTVNQNGSVHSATVKGENIALQSFKKLMATPLLKWLFYVIEQNYSELTQTSSLRSLPSSYLDVTLATRQLLQDPCFSGPSPTCSKPGHNIYQSY